MDVRLPDGTVIQGVPDGTTKAQLLKKLQDAKHPSSAALAWEMAQPNYGAGLTKLAENIGGKVTDLASLMGASPEVAAGAGYISNVGTQAVPALLTGFKNVGAPPVSMGEKSAKLLLQSAVKPTQADRSSGAAGKALQTMLQENIPPTAGGMDKATELARALNATVEGNIAASPATVSLNAVGQRLQEPARRAMTQVNPQEDINAVNAVWSNFKDSPLIQALSQPRGGTPNVPVSAGAQAAQDVSLPVQLAHALKKGTYQSLGGKSYGEMGSVATEAQKALARGLREEVAAAVPAVAEPLKREASLLNVKDVAMNRILAEANKNPMGLAALRIGDNPLSAASFLADRSALLKGLAAQLSYRGGQPQFFFPYATAAEAVGEKM